MKQYTFFIAGKAEDMENELSTSTIMTVTAPNDSLLSDATITIREDFIKAIKETHSMCMISITQINLIGVQYVRKDDEGKLIAVS